MCTALPSIGFIGLGIMGRPMAKHLCDAGYSVTVYNRTPSRSEEAKSFGAYVAQAPKALGERCDIVITMLTNPEAVRAVVEGPDGVLAAPKKGLVWIQMSTIDISSTHGFAARAAESEVTFVDCPVAGSKGPAEAAQLVLLAGAEKEPLEYVTPVLQRFGPKIVHAGEVGAGTALKLCMNLIVAQMTTALAESVALAQTTDVNPERIFDVIAASPALNCGYFQLKKQLLLHNDFPPAFALENMLKDVRFMNQEASARGLELPVTQAVQTLMEKAADQGHGKEDVASVITALGPQNAPTK